MKPWISKHRRTLSLLFPLLPAIVFALAGEPAWAQSSGGLDKINTFMDNVLSILRGASIAVVTIAIMWAGYKFLFKHADIAECGKILGGGLLIGGAAEIARFLLE
jgi:type IV secretion system protein VirB2/type IV secretion system protein PtlA